MTSYFLPRPRLNMVLCHADGSFRHDALFASVALLALALAFTYFGYLGAQSNFKIAQAVAGALVAITWTLYILFLHEVWVDDGRRKPL
jgi:hypothetical protein